MPIYFFHGSILIKLNGKSITIVNIYTTTKIRKQCSSEKIIKRAHLQITRISSLTLACLSALHMSKQPSYVIAMRGFRNTSKSLFKKI